MRKCAFVVAALLLLVVSVAYTADFYLVFEDFADGSWRSYSVCDVCSPPCRSTIHYSGPAPNLARSAAPPAIQKCTIDPDWPVYP